RLERVALGAALGDLLVHVRGRVGDGLALEGVDIVLDGRAHHQRGGQGGLAVVDVPDGADVDVRFGPLKYFLSHRSSAVSNACPRAREGRGKGGDSHGFFRKMPFPQSCCWDLNPETSSLPRTRSTD